MKKIFFDAEKLLSISAIVVGVCALTVSIIQTRILQEQQAMSVWPSIQYEIWTGLSIDKNDSIGAFSIHVENKGVGPGIIEKIDLNYDGKNYNGTAIRPLFEKIFQDYDLGHLDDINQTPLLGDVISPNKDLIYIKLNNKKMAARLVGIFKRMQSEKHFEILIHYKDVYGKRFIASTPQRPDDSL